MLLWAEQSEKYTTERSETTWNFVKRDGTNLKTRESGAFLEGMSSKCLHLFVRDVPEMLIFEMTKHSGHEWDLVLTMRAEKTLPGRDHWSRLPDSSPSRTVFLLFSPSLPHINATMSPRVFPGARRGNTITKLDSVAITLDCKGDIGDCVWKWTTISKRASFSSPLLTLKVLWPRVMWCIQLLIVSFLGPAQKLSFSTLSPIQQKLNPYRKYCGMARNNSFTHIVWYCSHAYRWPMTNSFTFLVSKQP